MPSPTIRLGDAADLDALHALYAHYARESPCTFDLEPRSEAAHRAWFDRFQPSGPYRLWVAEDEVGALVGYAASVPFREKRAYDSTVELSVYLRPDTTGRGLGARMTTTLIESIRPDVHRAIAAITIPNPASEKLVTTLGFRLVGIFREVGKKAGRYWDVAFYEYAM